MVQQRSQVNMENIENEVFEAETHWFHVFKSMVESGDVAAMGPHAVTIYLVIKAHTNFSTGRAFPSIETIVEKSGVSDKQVRRELPILAKFGYITIKKVGRKNEYTLREKITLKNERGRPTAVASWDYLPASVQAAVADLKNVLITGDFSGAKIIHIETLQLNVTEVKEGSINFNVQNQSIDMEHLPLELREKFLDAYTKYQAKKG